MVTRCEQLDSLLHERRETLCSLEANHDQVSSVVPSEVEGASAVDGCTRSLGGMEAPGTLGGTRFPSVIVPVCVVKGVGARACVRATPGESETVCVDEAPCASGTTCVNERVRMSEAQCVRETACVRSLSVREMTVGMREHATACPSVMTWCVSVVTRRSACVEWSLSVRVRRRRRRQMDKGRVAAVVVLGTAPGLHGGEREVRAVQRTRPPRARLRE